VSKDIF